MIFQLVAANHRHGFVSETQSFKDDTIKIGPGNLKLSFSSSSGQLKRIYNSKTGVNFESL